MGMPTKIVDLARLGTLSLLSFALVVTAHGQDSPGDQFLIEAVKRQDQAAITELLKQKVDVNTRQPDGPTALNWGGPREDLPTAKRLIQAGAKVNLKNDFGVAPLYLACANGSAAMIEILVEAGADTNAPLLTGETPLMTASRTGNLAAVDLLLKNGANVNAKEPVREQTALMWAIGEKQTAVARRLVERGADIQAVTTLGFNPLLFAAREGDLEVTKILLDAGADANSTSKDKLSALHVATIRGHAKVAILLLDRDAQPNADGPGFTPLHWAVCTWETEMNGANGIRAPKNHEWDRLRGVQDGKFALVKALLEHGADPNARLNKGPTRYGFTVTSQPKGSTPLVLAAFAGEAKIMRLLADHKADLSLKASNGLTPLLTAAGVSRFRPENAVPEEKLLAAVKMALELGSDINETDPGGNTALHGAAWIRSTKIIQFLADQGADLNAANKKKQTPTFVALRDGRSAGSGPKLAQSDVADLLTSLGASAVAIKPTGRGVASSGRRVDPSGSWRWEHREGGQNYHNLLKLTFHPKSNKITGTYQGRVSPVAIKGGTIRGDQLSVNVITATDGAPLVVRFSGRIKQDSLSGKLKIGVGGFGVDSPWSATRSVQVSDVVGSWDLALQTADGNTLNRTLTLKQQGENKELTGSYTGDGANFSVNDVKIVNNHLSFSISGDLDGNTFTGNYRVQPRGDKLSGKLAYDLNGETAELDVTGSRSPEKKPAAADPDGKVNP